MAGGKNIIGQVARKPVAGPDGFVEWLVVGYSLVSGHMVWAFAV